MICSKVWLVVVCYIFIWKKSICMVMNYLFNDLRNYWEEGNQSLSWWISFLSILNMGFSFTTSQAFGKTLQEINRLQSAETSFAKLPPPSFITLLKHCSHFHLIAPAALELLISCMIFKTFFFNKPDKTKISCNCKTRVILNYWFNIVLIRRFQKFNKKRLC